MTKTPTPIRKPKPKKPMPASVKRRLMRRHTMLDKRMEMLIAGG